MNLTGLKETSIEALGSFNRASGNRKGIKSKPGIFARLALCVALCGFL